MRVFRFDKFFKDAQGNESMTALVLFLSFWPATYVMVTEASENIYYAYMAAFAGLAANRQWAGRNANHATNEVLETSSDSTTTSERVVSRSSDGKQSLRGKKPNRNREDI